MTLGIAPSIPTQTMTTRLRDALVDFASGDNSGDADDRDGSTSVPITSAVT